MRVHETACAILKTRSNPSSVGLSRNLFDTHLKSIHKPMSSKYTTEPDGILSAVDIRSILDNKTKRIDNANSSSKSYIADGSLLCAQPGDRYVWSHTHQPFDAQPTSIAGCASRNQVTTGHLLRYYFRYTNC